MARAKEIANLDCDGSARAGARAVLEVRFREMLALREAALEFSDPEGVHDMRVASRRLRGAFRDFKFLYRSREFTRANKSIKSIAAALGNVRDQDVALRALEGVAKHAPARVLAGIERIADERRERREAARKQLAEAISEANLAKLEAKFTAAVLPQSEAAIGSDTNRAEQHNAAAARMSFWQSGRTIIALRFEDLHTLSGSLYRPLQSEPLHDMRIAAKRLRYALELFASCWGDSVITPFAKEVAALQSSLGELHDSDDWIADLSERLQYKPPVGRLGSATLAANRKQERLAALWLLQYFLKERTKHYQAALTRWHKWETSNFAGRLAARLDAKSKAS